MCMCSWYWNLHAPIGTMRVSSDLLQTSVDIVDVLSLPCDQSCRMSKIRRKVTVENSKTISDSSSSSTTTTTTTTSTSNPAGPSRRPSVFERLGPSTGSNAADVRDQWWTLQSLIFLSGSPHLELGAHPCSHHVCMCFFFWFLESLQKLVKNRKLQFRQHLSLHTWNSTTRQRI